MSSPLPLLMLLLLSLPVHAITFDFAVVGDPGNAAEVQPQGSFGSVGYLYKINRYETTNQITRQSPTSLRFAFQ